MIYGSVCSGIEAASAAWHPLGWRAAFFAEIDPFACAVLTERYPDVPLHGDFTAIQPGDYAPIELLVGGTPCQDFSVAGLRAGLAGERGGLTIEFRRLAGRLRPRWLVWENVPGVLSIDSGRAFGAFLGGLGQCGYGFAYRILDAQYFGVPQRRRRVFVVGYLGDWRPAAAVLFEPESLRGDTAPRRQAGQNAPTIPSRSTAGGGLGTDFDCDGGLISATVSPPVTSNPYGDHESREGLLVSGTLRGHPRPGSNSFGALAYGGNNTAGPVDVATACNAHGGPHGRLDFESETFVTHSLRADGFDASEDGTWRGTPLVAFSSKDHGADCGDLAPTLRAMNHSGSHANAGGQIAVALPMDMHLGGRGPAERPVAVQHMSVRRLTPRECERLQGFPDDWTLVTYRGKPAADGPRYRSIGNSMAVPVMRWIGERIKSVMECAP